MVKTVMQQTLFYMAFLLLAKICVAQDTVIYVPYDKHFPLKDGIYLTFQEFKQQKPTYTQFRIQKSGQFGSTITLERLCEDKKNYCKVDTCWGFVYQNTLYIFQGLYGRFYRIQILGALTHYFAYQVYSYSSPYYYDYFYGYPVYRTYRGIEAVEKVLDFETGQSFPFVYKAFASFLQQKDPELYEQLRKSKKRKKMIYHYLLRYNERHPISFPVYLSQ